MSSATLTPDLVRFAPLPRDRNQMMKNNPLRGPQGRAFFTGSGVLIGLGALAFGINASLFNGGFPVRDTRKEPLARNEPGGT